jgi:hypothetical protein
MTDRKNDTSAKSRSQDRVEDLSWSEEELKPEAAEAADGGLQMKPIYITSYVVPADRPAFEEVGETGDGFHESDFNAAATGW